MTFAQSPECPCELADESPVVRDDQDRSLEFVDRVLKGFDDSRPAGTRSAGSIHSRKNRVAGGVVSGSCASSARGHAVHHRNPSAAMRASPLSSRNYGL